MIKYIFRLLYSKSNNLVSNKFLNQFRLSFRLAFKKISIYLLT